MTNLPSSVRVGPLTYRITDSADEWADRDLSSEYGYADHRRGLIYVDTDGASTSMAPVILLHEVMHAAAFAAGQLDNRKRREEDWVVMVAPMLLDALLRSPDFTAFLLHDVETERAKLVQAILSGP